MKKLTILILAMFAVASFARNPGLMSYVQLINPVVDEALDGTGVDVSAYKGNALFLGEAAINTETNYTATITLQHSADNETFSTMTNINGSAVVLTFTGAFTNSAPETASIDSARMKKYVRAVVAQSGDATNAVSALLVFPMKSE